MTTTSDNIAAIERKAPGLHETEIARLAGSFDVGQHPAWVRVEQDGNGVNGGFYTCAAATETSPAYIRADIAADLARKTEALTGIGSAHDLVNDWLGEGTDDLPDNTPVRIEIGKRTIISDTLGSLRRARTLLNGGSDAQG